MSPDGQAKSSSSASMQHAFAAQFAGLPLLERKPEDEFLHAPAASGHYSATETTYWGFNIPEHRLNCEIYMWFHPVLRVCSASVYIWKGMKRTTLSCEYVNHYHYLPMPGDISSYRVDEAIDLRFSVIEPLKKIAIEYNDPQRNVAFSILNEAIMPPAGRPDGHHYAQAMRVTGQLKLFDEPLRIDGFFTRDHSWSHERRETARKVPPSTWMVGVFNEHFAFHAIGPDEPELEPEWVARYPGVRSGHTLRWGYVYRYGELMPLASLRKRTYREADGLAPKRFDMHITDVAGRAYNIAGTVQARMPWQTWQNINSYFCQTRWECEGFIGYGDCHEIHMNDFTHHFITDR